MKTNQKINYYEDKNIHLYKNFLKKLNFLILYYLNQV